MTLTVKIPTVSKFLCFFDLATGGLVIGWAYTIVLGLVLISLFIALCFGVSVVMDYIDETTILGVVMGLVVHQFLLIVFFVISAIFLVGVKSRSPKKCLPFVILSSILFLFALIEGLVRLNIAIMIFSCLEMYVFFVTYSLYVLFTYGDEQAAYEAHQNADSAGYEKYYEPEGYANSEREETGYQTTEFKGP